MQDLKFVWLLLINMWTTQFRTRMDSHSGPSASRFFWFPAFPVICFPLSRFFN